MDTESPRNDAPPVIVIGGAGGIGQAICQALAREGGNIVLADFDLAAATKAARQCSIEGNPRIEPHQLDITNDDQVAALISTTLERFGCLGGVVNAAGIEGDVQAVADYPVEVFEEVMRTNVIGAFYVMRHAVPAMVHQGYGVIVTIASTSSIRGRANISGYVASKHAVLGLTRSVALETSSTGVRVNAVLPGPIATRMTESLSRMSAALEDGHGDPLGRCGDGATGVPQDVAEVVVFLLSRGAAHVNGAAWVIDGGRTLG